MVTTLSRFVGKWSQRALSRLRGNGHSAVTLGGGGGGMVTALSRFFWGNGHSDVSFCLFFCVFFGGWGHSDVTFWGEMVTAMSGGGGGGGGGGGAGEVTALSRFGGKWSQRCHVWGGMVTALSRLGGKWSQRCHVLRRMLQLLLTHGHGAVLGDVVTVASRL